MLGNYEGNPEARIICDEIVKRLGRFGRRHQLGQALARHLFPHKLLLMSLPIFLAFLGFSQEQRISPRFHFDHGAIIRGDTARKELALVFTGHEFSDGGCVIRDVLRKSNIRAGFFFTGDFYRQAGHAQLISDLLQDGHYLGPHSDKHLLYCSWEDRNRLLVSKPEFAADLIDNYKAMSRLGIEKKDPLLFIPPYEWYNETIAAWSKELGLTLFNFTPGTSSNADYTTPDMPNYLTSEEIFRSILDYEKKDPHGLNGFLLLIHIGTHPDRKDKFYLRLDDLIEHLRRRGYAFRRIDELLAPVPNGLDRQDKNLVQDKKEIFSRDNDDSGRSPG